MKTVLVLGASGRFGSAAAAAFASAGWRVLAPPRPWGRPADMAAAAAGAQVLVYAVNPPYTRWARQALPALDHAIDVTRRLGAHLMLPGNVYAYGQAMPPRLQEHTPIAPDTPHGHIRAAMEARLEATAGLRATVIRAGDFFGHGQGNWLDLVIAKDIARGRLVYPGPRDRVHAWAWLPDLARAFVAVAERPGTGFETLHFGGHAATGDEFLAALRQAAQGLGLQPAAPWRTAGFPWPLVRAAGLVWPMGRALARMSYLWRVPHRLDGSRLAQRLGPALPVSPTLAEALQKSLLALGHGSAAADTAGAVRTWRSRLPQRPANP
jgi:nucleoside-diphosphate-sugar epimerase